MVMGNSWFMCLFSLLSSIGLNSSISGCIIDNCYHHQIGEVGGLICVWNGGKDGFFSLHLETTLLVTNYVKTAGFG